MSVLKSLAIVVLLGLTQISFAVLPVAAPVKPAELKYSLDFILQQVLIKKNIPFRADLEIPKLFVESKTPLKQFQDAVEQQWGFRPDIITNAYVVQSNEIYLLDEAAYYDQTKRCIDDSLAHELTHYVQVKYKKYDLNDESLEWDAVEIQTWFRETFCKL